MPVTMRRISTISESGPGDSRNVRLMRTVRQLQCDIPAPTKAMLHLDSVTGSVICTLTVSVTLAAVDRVTVCRLLCDLSSERRSEACL